MKVTGAKYFSQDDESDEKQAAEDDHADNQRGLPLFRLVRVQAERQEEEGKSAGDQEQADGVELDEVVSDGLPEGPPGSPSSL